MPSDEQDMAQALRLAVVAVVSAIVTATVIIGAGQFWISRSIQTTSAEQPLLINAAG